MINTKNKFPWRFFLKVLIGPWMIAFILLLILFFSRALDFKQAISILVLFFFVLVLFAIRLARQYLSVLNTVKQMITSNSNLNWVECGDIFEDSIYFDDLERSLSILHRKNIKSQKQAAFQKEELQAFIQSTQDAILVLDEQQKISSFNSQFSSHFLTADLKEKTDLLLTQIFRSPELLSAFNEVMQSKNSKKQKVELLHVGDKNSHYYIVNIYPLHTNQVVGMFHDVTELVKAEKIRIDFVTNASHELRTPMTSIKGYLMTMKEDSQSGRFEMFPQFLDTVLKNVNRLENLVNDMLSLSTLESHNDIKKEWVQIDVLTHGIVEQVKASLDNKNQKLIFKSSAEKLYADPAKVEQVLLNLIINANKYIPEEKTIEVIWEKTSTKEVLLRVRDNGPGIPSEHHARLFERFYRVDKGRAREQGGTGLGLAIVKHIMQSHGGYIEVKSKIGEGAEFICHFPL